MNPRTQYLRWDVLVGFRITREAAELRCKLYYNTLKGRR